MTDTKIDVQGLIGLIGELIEQAPDGVETRRSCYYRNDSLSTSASYLADSGTPAHCIAGQVVYTLGGEKALNSLLENESIAPDPADPDLGSEGEVENEKIALEYLTPEAVNELRRAQGQQDNGRQWGEVLDIMKERHRNV